MHENREISGASRSDPGRDRSAKAESHNADAHAPEKSDRAIVPMSQPNKGKSIPAEVGEGRVRAKENSVRSNTSPTQSGRTRVPGIERCAASGQVRFAATIQGKSRMRQRARTDLCGGRSAMVVPTATGRGGLYSGCCRRIADNLPWKIYPWRPAHAP
jgi:hypothetical protein